MICSYFDGFLLQGVDENRRQSSVFYLVPSLKCGVGLLANSQRSIFRIADPTLDDRLLVKRYFIPIDVLSYWAWRCITSFMNHAILIYVGQKTTEINGG